MARTKEEARQMVRSDRNTRALSQTVAVPQPTVAVHPPPIQRVIPTVAVPPPPIQRAVPTVAVPPPPIQRAVPTVSVPPPPIQRAVPTVAVPPPPIQRVIPTVAVPPPPVQRAVPTVAVPLQPPPKVTVPVPLPPPPTVPVPTPPTGDVPVIVATTPDVKVSSILGFWEEPHVDAILELIRAMSFPVNGKRIVNRVAEIFAPGQPVPSPANIQGNLNLFSIGPGRKMTVGMLVYIINTDPDYRMALARLSTETQNRFGIQVINSVNMQRKILSERLGYQITL